MRCQENEPDKNEPDDEEVVRQTVTEDIEKGPAEEQNAKTKQKDPDITFHTFTFLSPIGSRYTITNYLQIPYGKEPSTTTPAIYDLDFVIYI
jgi:hypothetical protein